MSDVRIPTNFILSAALSAPYHDDRTFLERNWMPFTVALLLVLAIVIFTFIIGQSNRSISENHMYISVSFLLAVKIALLLRAQRRAEEERVKMLRDEKRRRAEFRAGDVSGNNYAAWDEREMVGEPDW